MGAQRPPAMTKISPELRDERARVTAMIGLMIDCHLQTASHSAETLRQLGALAQSVRDGSDLEEFVAKVNAT